MHRIRLLITLALALLLGTLASPALAAAVPAGCEEPVARSTARNFYVDPVRGSSHGDGSRAHPWRTLEEVVHDGLFASTPLHRPGEANVVQKAAAVVERVAGASALNNPNAPIKPGDTVYLMSGDHGSVTLQGWFSKALEGYANNDFITIAAAPGQTPVLRQLKLLGATKWVFRGLTFQSLNRNPVPAMAGTNTKDYYLVVLFGPHENIILDHNHFLSAPDVSGWGIQDWVKNRVSGLQDYQGKCVAIINNLIENVGFGIATQASANVLIANNVIDHFADDGIDYGSDNLLIENNRITNSIEDGDGIHRDAMQGQPYTQATVVHDVTIRDNTVIRLVDPNLKYPAYLQGIDAFDGVWRGVKVTGNTIITDAGHGISYYGAHDVLIDDNVLLGDGGKVLPCSHISLAACLLAKVVYDRSTVPRIVVVHGKDGSASSDVVISRNVSSLIAVDGATQRVKVANNLCVPEEGKCTVGFPVDGKMQWFGKPGRYAGGNVVSDRGASELFTAFDTRSMKYDLHPKKGERSDPRGRPD